MEFTRNEKIAGGAALLLTAGALVYKATRPIPAPLLPAGPQTFVVQAPAGTTAAGLQTELSTVLGTTSAIAFTTIPVALEDPNAATLWSVAVTLTGPTSLDGLNQLFGPVGVWFLTTPAPVVQFTPNSYSVTAGTPTKVTLGATDGTTAADVAAYLTSLGLPGTPAQSGTTWTLTTTPTTTATLNDLTVTYGGASQSFAIQSTAPAATGVGAVPHQVLQAGQGQWWPINPGEVPGAIRNVLQVGATSPVPFPINEPATWRQASSHGELYGMLASVQGPAALQQQVRYFKWTTMPSQRAVSLTSGATGFTA